MEDEINIDSTFDLKYTTLYDHYKESISYLKNDLTKRDKLTLNVFISFIIYFLIDIKPSHSVAIANTWIKGKLDVSLGINYNLLSTTILLFLLWSVVRYFQMCLYIERQYNYIHTIENKMNGMSKEDMITREGYSYLDEYPLLSALIHRIYNFFLPVGIAISFIIKIIFIPSRDFGALYIINTFIQIMIILCVFLYLLFTYRDIAFVQELNSKVKSFFIKIHLYKED